MRQIPISFTADMVRAERKGIKTETRRLTGLKRINEDPDAWTFKGWGYKGGKRVAVFVHKDGQEVTVASPYGEKGDRLWVKETCWVDNNYMPGLNRATTVVIYAADEQSSYEQDLIKAGSMQRVNGRFMYKELARTWLEVVDVRVERLKDINFTDALAEGILFYQEGDWFRYKDYLTDARGYGHPDHDYPTVSTAVESYFTLFKKVNPKAAENPWLWVVKFPKSTDHAHQ